MTTVKTNTKNAVAPPTKLHPDVDQREQVSKAAMHLGNNTALMTEADLKALHRILGNELRERNNVKRANLPAVGERVKIVGGSKWAIGHEGDVVEVRKSRVAVRLPGRADVSLPLDGVQRLLAK